jgi:signal transduction histidine kinase
VRVQDTGVGMPPDVVEKLFTGRVRSTKPGGTGLGTRVVKNVVDAHGGRLQVDSVENVGTTIAIRIPLRLPAAP